jgi:hypothetical protein
MASRDADVQNTLVDGVVQGVAAVVVARLQHPCDHESLSGEDQRRGELPQQLGGNRHRPLASGRLE